MEDTYPELRQLWHLEEVRGGWGEEDGGEEDGGEEDGG